MIVGDGPAIDRAGAMDASPKVVQKMGSHSVVAEAGCIRETVAVSDRALSTVLEAQNVTAGAQTAAVQVHTGTEVPEETAALR